MNRATLAQHYHRIWGDLREAQAYIVAAILIFAAGGVLALLIPHVGEKVIALVLEYFKPFKDKQYLELMVAIFLQNATSAFLAIALGFLLGIIPVLGAFFNGIVLGAIIRLDPLHIFMIIPNGLFELPAIFIAWGLGMWCAGGLFHAQRLETIPMRIKKSLHIYLSLIVPLLIIAAIIEVLAITILSGT
jgi:stage II sporulation protein M